MYAVEFYVFAVLVLGAAFMSVKTSSVFYAVLFHMQAVVAVAGILAGLNAGFVGVAVLLLSVASMLVFLMFVLVVFNARHARKAVWEKQSKAALICFAAAAAQTAYLFFKPYKVGERTMTDFSLPVLGDILYTGYGSCVLVFAVLILSCAVGASALLVKKKEGG